MAGPASTDVPDRYDVVFSLNDGTTYGFLYADSVESNLPFRTHKALYSYSPTFLERQNLSNTYGDNFQDFFLTATQADFSEGEQQKFFRINDPDSVRKYWRGSNVDPTTVPGNTTLTASLTSITLASASGHWIGSTFGISTGESSANYSWYGLDTTNLYGVKNSAGTWTVTTIGAHGLTASSGIMNTGDSAVDGGFIYLCSYGVLSGVPNNSGIIRKWGGGSFSTFSTTGASSLAFLNNILYGYQKANDALVSYDTSGTATTQFQWKNADGTNQNNMVVKLIPYGGSLYIMRTRATTELWVYDGSGCRKLEDFPIDFKSADACVNNGIVYVAGYTSGDPNVGTYIPQVYYYANGSLGKLWESRQTPTSSGKNGSIAAFGNGVLFQDPNTNDILKYDLALGGTHTVQTASSLTSIVVTNDVSAYLLPGLSGAGQIYPPTTTNYNSSGYVQTSQYDFDNTLTKVFRAIKIDADIPANTSADIAYQLDGAGGTYTSLKTGAASGTEYTLPANTTGRSISVKVTLNSATGSATPTLKHVYVRAAPILQQFRRREYLFDISGGSRDELGKSSRRTRDLTAYPKDPITACNDLVKIATQTIPFTVYDRFTTSGMTCLADLQQNQAGYDGFAIYEVRPNVFIGRINLREV